MFYLKKHLEIKTKAKQKQLYLVPELAHQIYLLSTEIAHTQYKKLKKYKIYVF